MTYEEIARRNKRLFAILETHPNHQQAKYELEQNLERLSQHLTRARYRAKAYHFVRTEPTLIDGRYAAPVIELESGKSFATTSEAAKYFGLESNEVKNNVNKGRFYK